MLWRELFLWDHDPYPFKTLCLTLCGTVSRACPCLYIVHSKDLYSGKVTLSPLKILSPRIWQSLTFYWSLLPSFLADSAVNERGRAYYESHNIYCTSLLYFSCLRP